MRGRLQAGVPHQAKSTSVSTPEAAPRSLQRWQADEQTGSLLAAEPQAAHQGRQDPEHAPDSNAAAQQTAAVAARTAALGHHLSRISIFPPTQLGAGGAPVPGTAQRMVQRMPGGDGRLVPAELPSGRGPIQLLKVGGAEKTKEELGAMLGLGEKKLKLALKDQATLDYVLSIPSEKRANLSAADIKSKNPNPEFLEVGSDQARVVAERRREGQAALAEETERLGAIDLGGSRQKSEPLDVGEGMAALSGFIKRDEQEAQARKAKEAEEAERQRKARRTIPEILQEEAPTLSNHKYEGKWQNGESDLGVFAFPGGTEIHIHFKHGTKKMHKAHTRGSAEINLFRADVATAARDIDGWQGAVLKKCCDLIVMP